MAKLRSVKVGILVECGRGGLEDVLCRRICDLLGQRTGVRLDVDIAPMDNKASLIQDCGTVTARLLGDGCERVIVLWDERPAWPEIGEPLCWRNDREEILARLDRARVAINLVHLVCVEREFESWLLFDHNMISDVLSTEAHPVRVPPQRHPDRMGNPKGAMTSLFRKYRGWHYNDVQHARQFDRCLQDLHRLCKCATFRRFAERVTGQRNLFQMKGPPQ